MDGNGVDSCIFCQIIDSVFSARDSPQIENGARPMAFSVKMVTKV